jgi:hypothetical protein
MAAIITYDIPSKHTEFKAAMFKLGYYAQILDANSKTVYLPNTTLYHASKTPTAAVKDALAICSGLGLPLERCIATTFSFDWSGILGEPFTT